MDKQNVSNLIISLNSIRMRLWMTLCRITTIPIIFQIITKDLSPTNLQKRTSRVKRRPKGKLIATVYTDAPLTYNEAITVRMLSFGKPLLRRNLTIFIIIRL